MHELDGALCCRAFETAAGYFRVDWFTPGGVATFGDSRLTVMGTDGYLEVRPNVDLAGRPGGSHLFLVAQLVLEAQAQARPPVLSKK